MIIWYLGIALILFCLGLGLFLADNTTPKTHVVSWVILLTAPFFWPIVVPLSCWELARKKLKNQDRIFFNRQSSLRQNDLPSSNISQ